jgi:hypothetical protein
MSSRRHALVLALALIVVNGADAARAARQRVPRSVVRSLPSARHVVMQRLGSCT